MTELARVVDLLALSFALGATLWFFFVQSPVLFKRMGRARFVPLQMSLVKVLFRTMTVAIAIMLGASVLHHGEVPSLAVCSAVAALGGVAMNSFIVVPRALKAGAVSMREGEGDESGVAAFASYGGGKATQFWHRMIVLFVLVMLGGLLPHAYSIANK